MPALEVAIPGAPGKVAIPIEVLKEAIIAIEVPTKATTALEA